MIQSLLSRLTSITLLALSLACGSDSTAPVVDPTGTYALKTLNGVAMPATFGVTGSSTVFNSGSFVVSGTGYTNTLNITEKTAGQADVTTTIVCAGTYTLSGAKLTFTEEPTSSDCGGLYTATLSNGNTLTVDFDFATVGVYQK